jgi:hypothetical protein
VNDFGINYLYIKEKIGSLQPKSLLDCDGAISLMIIEDVHIYLIKK